ncbi:hypothetical protein Tsubulata_031757, partial [Turnera subulata]
MLVLIFFDLLSSNDDQRVERVEALSLDMSQVSRMIQLCPKVFEEMDNLRLLRFYYKDADNATKLHLPQDGLECLPNTVRLLRWDLYPSPSLPSNFCPENMVYLKMPGSNLTQLWEGDNVPLVNLKVCNLWGSKELIKIMDLSGVPNLEELDLGGCSSLVEIPSSLQHCRKLTKIIVSGCVNLCGFPSDLRLTSLEEVGLERCPRITQLPKLPSTIKILYMEESGIKQNLVNLRVWDLSESKELIKIMDFSGVPNLEELDLRGCWSLVEIPSSIQLCRKLTKIIVSYCINLCGFPSDLRLTFSLEEVDLHGCPRITEFPQLPSTVKKLYLDKTGIK